MLRRLERANLGLIVLSSFLWRVTNRRLGGTSQIFRIVAYLLGHFYRFFRPGRFVGNPVLVLTAQNAAKHIFDRYRYL